MSEPAVRTYRAQLLWLGPGRHLAPGELRVAGDRIVEVTPVRGGRVPRRALFPGLVNAHVHLQIPALAKVRRHFLPWVKEVIRARSTVGPTEHTARARLSLRELLADGVTAVGEVDSTGLSPAALREVALGGTCYQELVGFDVQGAAARDLMRSRAVPGTRRCPMGWSPHAPYSVSAELFRAARSAGKPLAVHVSETAAEERFLRTGCGEFRDLLAELGRLPVGFRAPGVSAVAWLDRLGLLTPRTTLVHAQHVQPAESRRIAEAGSPVVVCPGTIRYFRRPAPPVPQWLRLGIPVALGTDSRASNTVLSMRHEMAWARSMWPELAPETVLQMATRNGGGALCRPTLGRLRRGAPASFFAVPMPGDAADCIDALTSAALEPDAVWLHGQRVRTRP